MSEYIRLLEPPFRTWDLNRTMYLLDKPNLREEREVMAEISTTTTKPPLSLLILKVLVFLHLPTPSEDLTFLL